MIPSLGTCVFGSNWVESKVWSLSELVWEVWTLRHLSFAMGGIMVDGHYGFHVDSMMNCSGLSGDTLSTMFGMINKSSKLFLEGV